MDNNHTSSNKTDELAEKLHAEREAIRQSRSGKKKGKSKLCIILVVALVIEFFVAGFKYPGFFLKGKDDPDEYLSDFSEGLDSKDYVAGDYDSEESDDINYDSKPSDILPGKYDGNIWDIAGYDTATMPAEGGEVTLCGITVSSTGENLESDETVMVVDYGTIEESGEDVRKFDISLGEHRQFEVPVAVTIPIELAPDEDVAVVHRIEETGEWVPLAANYDEKAGTVTAYFSSFSEGEVRKEKKDNHNSLYAIRYQSNGKGEKSTRYATMGLSDYYWSILSNLNPEVMGSEATKYVADPALYAQNFQSYKDNPMREAIEAFDKTSLAFTVLSPVADICSQIPAALECFKYDYSGSIGESLGVVTLIMCSFQALRDFEAAGGDANAITSPAANAYKNLLLGSGSYFSSLAGYSSIGFSLAFVGVTVFAFQLDKFIDDSKASMSKRTADIFDAYFEQVAPFDKNEWYQVFYNAYYNSNNDPDVAMQVVSNKIDSTVEAFWSDIYVEGNLDVLIAATEADTKNFFTGNNIYFYNVSEEEKQSLNIQMKQRIWKKFKKEVMPLVNRFLVERMQDFVYGELSKITRPYNEMMRFTVKEEVTDIMTSGESEAKYAGCTLAFGRDGTPLFDWDPINIPEDMTDGWSAEYDCTVMGYLEAKCPNNLLIYETERDFEVAGEPIAVVPFEAVITGEKLTQIDVTGVSDNLVWGLDEIRYCPSYSADKDYYKTNIVADDIGFAIAHACEFGCDFTIEGIPPAKILYGPDDFVVGMAVSGDLGVDCNWENFNVFVSESDGSYSDSPDYYFVTETGAPALTKGGTLYGKSAVKDIECVMGARILLKINSGEIVYVYRAMTEAEAQKNVPIITELDEPIHFVKEGSIPAVEKDMTVNYTTYGTFSTKGDTCYMRANRQAHFKMDSVGNFSISIPSLTGFKDGNKSIDAQDAITITGNLRADEWPTSMVNGEDSRVLECYELNCPSTIHYELTTDAWGDGRNVQTNSINFRHTNPDAQEKDRKSSHVYLHILEDGRIVVEILLRGEGIDSWTENYEGDIDSGTDNYSASLEFELTGEISAGDAQEFWK